MRVEVLQENLDAALGTVLGAVAGKSTLPVLSHVLLATDDGRLKLFATNLEVGVSVWIGAKVYEEGAVCMPAKLINDYVGGLPKGPVDLRLDTRTQSLKVTCGDDEATFKGIDADEMPTVPKPNPAIDPIILDAKTLAEVVRVGFAAANDDTRPALAGVHMTLNGKVTASAADGFKLAHRVIPTAVGTSSVADLLVPVKSLRQLARLVEEGMDVALTIDQNGGNVIATVGDMDRPLKRLTSRLIDGKYPDVERVFPQNKTVRAVFDKSLMLKKLSQAALFATHSSNIVRLTMRDGEIVLSANAAEVGDNKAKVPASVVFSDDSVTEMAVAGNVSFLTSTIQSVPTDQVAIENENPQRPVVFRPVGLDDASDGDYLTIVMPMTVR